MKPKTPFAAILMGIISILTALGCVAVLGVILVSNGTINLGGNTQTGVRDADKASPVNGKLNLYDNKNYFIIVDGVRYDTDTKVKDILDKGYTQISGKMDQVLEAGHFIVNTYGMRWNDDTQFAICPINRTGAPRTVEECTIYEFSLHDTWYKKISIIGGLTFGSKVEEVESLFDGNYFRKSTRSEREALRGSDFQMKDESDVILTYHADAKSIDGTFTFYFDDGGGLRSIILRSNKK